MIAAAYWLFVVNGPTPVVKARIEDFEDISTNSLTQQEEFADTDYQELLIKLLKLFVPLVLSKEDPLEQTFLLAYPFY